MDKGVDTTKLKKTLEEGKSKLVISNANTVSEYDVEGFFHCLLLSHIAIFASTMIWLSHRPSRRRNACLMTNARSASGR